ncbi:EbsA protein [Streptococcus rubneri]|jgi:pore forming protein|uniref:EbsA protein n=1 Tax=Streptococcus rubneri TaxID=1234680 RepID=A0A4Z1DVM1_9STRE|nr:EbsA family protein [Streptococcus rubneri]MBK4774308.1 EbsA protein [Streptococcus rubneri]TGN92137.1 EbsA protein [Streptococcus rubneri]
MIKIFGKIRYHWQPDLSMLITYWSLSVIPVFIGLALMYESSSIPTLVLFSFFLFMAMMAVGVHRYFTIYDDGILRIITANPFTPIKVPISSIDKVEVTKNSIRLIFNDGSRSRTFCMRKWPKKYFINALALNDHFKGEIELTDNFIHVDYYQLYYADNEKSS